MKTRWTKTLAVVVGATLATVALMGRAEGQWKTDTSGNGIMSAPPPENARTWLNLSCRGFLSLRSYAAKFRTAGATVDGVFKAAHVENVRRGTSFMVFRDPGLKGRVLRARTMTVITQEEALGRSIRMNYTFDLTGSSAAFRKACAR